jgi:hypothetical protein
MTRSLCHILLVTVPIVLFAKPATAADPTAERLGTVDEGTFREGLRKRGLDAWLDAYLAETPPVDEADSRLREREQLLEQAGRADLPSDERRELLRRARGILEELIKTHPKHAGRPRWLLELIRDRLEREDAELFARVLLYDLPGGDRQAAGDITTDVLKRIAELNDSISAEWEWYESLDETAMTAATASGAPRRLEMLQSQAAMLEAWARLYQALGTNASTDDRDAMLRGLLEDVTRKYGWTLPDQPPAQRRRALIIAARTARALGRAAEAELYARDVIQVSNPESGDADGAAARQAALLAVLEQLRAMRDRGRFDAALEAVDQATQWIDRIRSDDVSAHVALALTHKSILSRRAKTAAAPGAGGEPGDSSGDGLPGKSAETTSAAASAAGSHNGAAWLEPPSALSPLENLCARGPDYCEALYAAIAGTVRNAPLDAKTPPFVTQLLLGAAVADCVRADDASDVRDRSRLDELLATASDYLRNAPATASQAWHGEMEYLLGRARYLTGARLEAVNTLASLAERRSEHYRSTEAARQATAIAQEMLGGSDEPVQRTVRDAFVRAGHLLRERDPDQARARSLSYYMGIALEQNRRLEEAAAEYERVPAESEHALEAQLGRVRCFRAALEQASSEHTLSQPDLQRLGSQAQTAADQAGEAARVRLKDSANPGQKELAAKILLAQAGVLNHRVVDQAARAVEVLDHLSAAVSTGSPLVPLLLQERIQARERLQQYGPARDDALKLVEVDGERAGGLLAMLVESARTAVLARLDQGEAESAGRIAAAGAQLAGDLDEWADTHGGKLSARERLTVRVWEAWFLLAAGKSEEAFSSYESLSKQFEESSSEHAALAVEIDLGRAECLLALDRAEEALPVFTRTWQASPEGSADWWRAYAGSLRCHARLGHDAREIVQSIRQQRTLSPELGGPRWSRVLTGLEASSLKRLGEADDVDVTGKGE